LNQYFILAIINLQESPLSHTQKSEEPLGTSDLDQFSVESIEQIDCDDQGETDYSIQERLDFPSKDFEGI
jgi:hypothetical protein